VQRPIAREIAQRLDVALATPGAGPRDAPARQRTLRATIDWSVALLDEPERDAFIALPCSPAARRSRPPKRSPARASTGSILSSPRA
jgi:predicted ATPase